MGWLGERAFEGFAGCSGGLNEEEPTHAVKPEPASFIKSFNRLVADQEAPRFGMLANIALDRLVTLWSAVV